ncbi:4'-phosphopantetheinyl transferase [Streptomyces sp. NPDC048337]|uniref:4'-phosphopantetheinyl transferase family protein n=1 Tax=Streptomyces sp. NPDC048337 TaxID=3365535 RepID=UPI003720090C
MIEELLPTTAFAEESFGDLPESVLYPQEKALVAASTDERRREFATVRGNARAALARLGIPPAPILPGTRGAPGWPEGIVGSMTHCAGYRAAAVARATDLAAISVDAEPNQPIANAGTRALVTIPEERLWLNRLGPLRPDVHWDRLVFSAKESVYKAWYPITGRWLDFDEVMITVDAEARTFHARLLVPGPTVDGTRLTAFNGTWLARRGLLITAIALPRAARPTAAGASRPTAHR